MPTPALAGARPSSEDPGAALLVTAARFARTVSRHTATDVPAARLRLLAQVAEMEPVGISDLAAADRCRQPTMSDAVQKLCRLGLLTKRPHPDDARSALVSLTDAGHRELATNRRLAADYIATLLARDATYTMGDVRAAVELLRHLVDQAPQTSARDHT